MYQFYEVPSLNESQVDALYRSFNLPEPLGLVALGLHSEAASVPGPPWVVSAANLQGFAIWAQIALTAAIDALRFHRHPRHRCRHPRHRRRAMAPMSV